MSKEWGTPTWYFFHSFAEHINDDFYKANRNIICDLLRNICFNLPCEECTKHAVQYTKNTLQGRFLPDKESLKNYFFAFHNSVNMRTFKSEFHDYDMYKRSKLEGVINWFIQKYGSYRNPHRGFSDQMNRNNIIKELKQLIINNSSSFTWL